MDVHGIMDSLGPKRPVFHSEADFQFALASEMSRLYDSLDIRLEVPFGFDRKGRIDILARDNGSAYPIELKYLKKALRYTEKGEGFALADGARDMDMRDCVSDIARIESFRGRLEGFQAGYAIWLTNDRAYWDADYDASYYEEFHAPDGSIKSGGMRYAEVNQRTGKRPWISREGKYSSAVVLSGKYHIEWRAYGDLGVPNGRFMYAAIKVP